MWVKGGREAERTHVSSNEEQTLFKIKSIWHHCEQLKNAEVFFLFSAVEFNCNSCNYEKFWYGGNKNPNCFHFTGMFMGGGRKPSNPQENPYGRGENV